jgi:hypothetical protein
VPYRLVGRLVHDGKVVLYLGKGDSVLSATLGETVEGIYKVASITDTEIGLIYLPLNEAQVLPIAPSAALPSMAPGAPNAVLPPAAGAVMQTEPGNLVPSAQVIDRQGRR